MSQNAFRSQLLSLAPPSTLLQSQVLATCHRKQDAKTAWSEMPQWFGQHGAA